MRSNFIAAWVTQQQRVFNQSTRGIMTPENRQVLENEAEAGMAAIERAAAEKALTDAADAFASAEINLKVFSDPAVRERWSYSNDTRRGMVESLRARAAALGLTAGGSDE